MSRIQLYNLKLSEFRNYASLALNFSGAPVVLYGTNGSGKTNILEAISLLTAGRGFRRAALTDLDRSGSAESWAVHAELMGLQGHVDIGTGRDPQPQEKGDGRLRALTEDGEEKTEKRLIKIDGKWIKNQNELSRHVVVVWLIPQMDGLFIEGAIARRKYLDKIVTHFDPEHAGRIAAYEHSVRERNRLLFNGYSTGARGIEGWLDAIEQKIVEKSSEIAAARMNLVDILNAAVMMAEDAFPKAFLALHGSIEAALAQGFSALQAESLLKDSLSRAREKDARAGRTSEGAHVSFLSVEHTGKKMEAAHCSTGEQKAMLLSLALAQVRAARAWKNVTPLLLLDEVVAHLDAARRKALANAVQKLGSHTFLTGTDVADFSEWVDAERFEVSDGSIIR